MAESFFLFHDDNKEFSVLFNSLLLPFYTLRTVIDWLFFSIAFSFIRKRQIKKMKTSETKFFAASLSLMRTIKKLFFTHNRHSCVLFFPSFGSSQALERSLNGDKLLKNHLLDKIRCTTQANRKPRKKFLQSSTYETQLSGKKKIISAGSKINSAVSKLIKQI
jgi:hypothetical protein